VVFLHKYAKNPDYPACFWSLQGKKIHVREFLYGFMRKAQQTPSSLSHLWIFAPPVAQKSRLSGVLSEFAG
jgi:hypothetical protein